MATMRSVLPSILLFLVIGCSTATNQEKIIGVWVVTKSTKSSPSLGDEWEFTKDGEMIVTSKVGEKPFSIKGNYTVEGDMLSPTTIALCFAAVGLSEIQKLNRSDLILETGSDGKNNDTIELKRKK